MNWLIILTNCTHDKVYRRRAWHYRDNSGTAIAMEQESKSTLKRLIFPSFLLALQAIFIVIFGLLVRYDDGGRANRELELLRELNASGRLANLDDYVQRLESTRDTTKIYPCERNLFVLFAVYNVVKKIKTSMKTTPEKRGETNNIEVWSKRPQLFLPFLFIIMPNNDYI